MKQIFYGCLFAFVLFSCANKGSISGGEKDETPPKILESSPAQGSANFSGNSFKLDFDENIKVQNINNQLIVSPPLEGRPKIKRKARSIEVVIDEELKPNTTYSFNFGDAIQDLNEGNALSGYTYVFSTGEDIDSLELSGMVRNAEDGKPAEDTWVLLYKSLADSAFQTTKPYYLTKTDEEGNYNFNYLAEGEYNLYALKDNNFNYQYDLEDESLAYLPSSVRIPSDEPVPELQLFTTEKRSTFLRDVENTGDGRFRLVANGNIDSLKLSSDDFDLGSAPATRGVNNDTLTFWLPPNFNKDEFRLYASQVSTDYSDTVRVDYEKKPVLDTVIRLKPQSGNTFFYNGDVSLISKTPLVVNNRAVSLLEDSLSVAGGADIEVDSKNPASLLVKYPWLSGKQYNVALFPDDVSDIYGRSIDTLEFQFKAAGAEDLSELFLQIRNIDSTKTYISQLKQQGNAIYAFEINAENNPLTISKLKPGSYTLWIIQDDNENGKWDSGNYEERKLPEKVYQYPEKVTLRGNWTVEVEFSLE